MQWAHPTILWGLLAWAAAALLGAAALARRQRDAHRIGRPDLLERLQPPAVARWRRRRLLLLLASGVLLTLAAARPRYGRLVESVRAVGLNVMLAVDCSNSMRARDGRPGPDGVPASRMERAQLDLKWLLRRLEGHRVGVVAFAGTAQVQCPLTLDYDLAAVALDALGPEAVAVQGTDLGRAIDAAVDAFERSAPEGGRILILLTDGEDHEGRAEAAARRAADAGVVIFAVGIGDPRGAPIRDADGRFMEGPDGAIVNTRLQLDALRRLTEITGGEALAEGEAPGAVVDRLTALLRARRQVELEARRTVMYRERFQWFLLPALLLLLGALADRPAPAPIPASAPASPAAVRPRTEARLETA